MSLLLAPAPEAAPRDYSMNLSPHKHAFRFSFEGEPVRRGRNSERFELRDGDCGGSDCRNPRYRSEIRIKRRGADALLNKDIWYGWSFYNETIPSFPADVALKVVLAQWKLGGEARSILRFVQLGQGEGNWRNCARNICTRPSDNSEDVVVQLDDMNVGEKWGAQQNFGQICRLFSMKRTKGRWTDIVLRTNFGTDENGYLQIWVNDRLKCDYRGKLVSDLRMKRHLRPNHRRGISAVYTERWDAKRPNTPKPTMIAYFDEFLSGSSREEVDPRMREKAGLRAKD
ncbi:MAG: polysaccharide lyase [Rhodobacteraceae bacterium]|nr:polysaccharide lyase [Paracoccaceae bacterium]